MQFDEVTFETLGGTDSKGIYYSKHWFTQDIEGVVEERNTPTINGLILTIQMIERHTQDKYVMKEKVSIAKNDMWQKHCEEVDRAIGGGGDSEA